MGGQRSTGQDAAAMLRRIRDLAAETAADHIPGQHVLTRAILRRFASRLTAAGKPASPRALRSEGIKGSNQALSALARAINAELADAPALPARRERHGSGLVPDEQGRC